jgi:hypothetical protein
VWQHFRTGVGHFHANSISDSRHFGGALPGKIRGTVALLGGLALLSACSSAKPLYTAYDEHGEPILSKKIERHEELDLFHHWTRPIYVAPDFSIAYSLPAERIYDPAHPQADTEGYVIAPRSTTVPPSCHRQGKKELSDQMAHVRERLSYESAGLTMREAAEKKEQEEKAKAKTATRAASQDAITSASAIRCRSRSTCT